MIDRAVEEDAIRRALDEGYLTANEIADQAQEHARWGPRMAAFLHSGLLSEPLAQRLLEQAAEGGEDGTPPGPGAAPPDSRGPETRGGERFEMGELIGQGGMGTVHRAYDRSLKRQVALKFLRSDDPDRIARFLREAQAQARVDHENVCRVYEAGELGGRPYIAMQILEGQPLFVMEGETAIPSPALQEMSAEQKVRILRQVAEGIHAAHREGLIHRDIKPSNIMLERQENGAFKPYVLDFGLAREVASAGVTSMGLAVGTPNFMSPEQARGESALDRRTDVYGLGATLYAMLAGRPPFEGPSSLDVMVKLTEEEPPPLPNASGDLATIVSKCLQKEPAQRYDSARALAEDLGRYLDGEPIAARKTNLLYRLLKKARKHRKLVAAGAIASLAFLVLAVTSVRAQLRAQERARLAGAFGQEVKAIESRMRIAYLAPAHDIRMEKAAIRQRMAAIEAQIQQLGAAAEGPGRYAIGRGHLALQEYDAARENLDRSWKSGYREREVAYALGQVMGALYHRALEAAYQTPDPKQREEKQQEAARTFRDPALSYIRQSRGLDVESPEYVEALVAFYEKRYPEALKQAQAASARLPWLHEARGLEARIFAIRGYDAANRGRHDAASSFFGQAEAAYRGAMDVGRSDPNLPEAFCRLSTVMMMAELFGRGRPIEALFEKGLEMSNRALRLDPDSASAHDTRSRLLWRMAQSETRQGKDPREKLARSVEASREALRLRPDIGSQYASIGSALYHRAVWESAHGIDAMPTQHEAIRAFDRGLALAPNAMGLINGQALCYVTLAGEQWNRGQDPRPAWHKAEELYMKATGLTPGYQDFNLADLNMNRASWSLEHGSDPGPALETAAQTGQRALAVDPTNPMSQGMLALVYELRAEFALAAGDDPRPSVHKLVEHAQIALTHSPRDSDARRMMVSAAVLLGRFAREKSADPQPMIREGWQRAAKLLEVDQQGGARNSEASLALFEAEWRLSRGLDPTAVLARARQALAEALRINAKDTVANTRLAEVHWRLAQWHGGHSLEPRTSPRGRASGQAARAEITHGLAAAEKVLAIDPHHARALALCGALYLEQARASGAGSPARAALLARARDSLEQALAVNHFLSREYAPLLEQARKKLG